MTSTPTPSAPKRILAVASGGGHWLQLMRLHSVLDGHQVHYACNVAGYREALGDVPFTCIQDAHKDEPFLMLKLLWQMVGLVRSVRPEIVITTGAAPGLVALAAGKLFGARTIWIDSIANAVELSFSGRLARRVADLWLTQWPHLAKPDGPHCCGAML